MKIAKNSDKNKVVEILTNSFIDNKSINYIIPNDNNRVRRIRELMAYSFDMCMLSGKVCLADDEKIRYSFGYLAQIETDNIFALFFMDGVDDSFEDFAVPGQPGRSVFFATF